MIVSGTGEPMTSQFVPFAWEVLPQPVGQQGLGEWVPYQCLSRQDTEIVGWEGEGCDPIENGYPSVCGCITDEIVRVLVRMDDARRAQLTCSCVPEEGDFVHREEPAVPVL